MSREQSAIIKGLAILLMLIYHLGNIKGISGLDNIFHATLSRSSFPISYFMIISGYGLYLSYGKGRLSWSYLFKRTLRLYIAYWLVLAIFVFGIGTIVYPGKFTFTVKSVLLNLTGWRWDYCNITWFLLPYILVSLSSKWVFPLFDRLGNVISLIVAAGLYVSSSFLISRYFDPWLNDHYAVYHVILWAQTLLTFTIGAVMAKLIVTGKKITWDKLQGCNALVILLIVAEFAIRGQFSTSALNPLHATLVTWLMLHLEFSPVPRKVLVELGNKSMIMWLAQGFIATVMFSEYFVLLRWPALILIVWVIICYLIACLLMPVVDAIARGAKLR